MARLWQYSSWLLVSISTLFTSSFFINLNTHALAQSITLDGTLGTPGTLTGPNYTIPQAAGQAVGNNLFHSFGKFNLNTNEIATFQSNPNIQNILSRVTGGTQSVIDGLIRTQTGVNLFFINPSGIIFGKNASLDVGGSFVASTANSFKFANGSEFSAINPQKAPLLTVNLTPGLQYGSIPKGATIANTGNLATGQNLILVADTLDLQGQLKAGRDLTLQAQDTLKVKDSATIPFVATAGRNLLVQGNQNVDIFALNHPNSGFFSGGDILLRSGNLVSGDAQYTAAGNFRIEQLDDSLGNLVSPNNTIIRAGGDVSFNSYEGGSLHILAGGSVKIPGKIYVATPGAKSSLSETITLSDGKTVVAIDGTTKPTVDIRAGSTAVGIQLGVTDSKTGLNSDSSNSNTPTRGDIQIGQIYTPGEAEGLVFLTNQYRPNSASGNIQVGTIDISTFDYLKGGTAFIDSRGDIKLNENLNPFAAVNSGNGGSVTLLANQDIITRDIYTANFGMGAGGNITLNARNGKINTGSILSEAYYGNAGNITLSADSNITTNYIGSNTKFGNGGAITLTAKGNINTQGIGASSIIGNAGDTTLNAGGSISTFDIQNDILNLFFNGVFSTEGNGKSGNIRLTAGGDITASYIDAGVYGQGNAGNIFINTTGGSVTITYSYIGAGVAYASSGRGGTITINTAKDINIQTGIATSAPLGTGPITLNSGGSIRVNGGIVTRSYFGDAGAITLTANNGEIKTALIDASAYGNGGDITLSSPKAVFSLEDNNLQTDRFVKNNRLIISDSLYKGNGGNIRITANSVNLIDSDISTKATGIGNAGNIFISVPNSFSLDSSRLFTSLEPGSNGKGGNIEISAGSVSLNNFSLIDTATFGQGDAGNVFIQANSIALEGSGIFSITAGNGKGGNITLRASDGVSLSNRSNLSTAVDTSAVGDGGNVTINAPNLSLTGGSQLQALTRGAGKAGDIQLDIRDRVIVSGIGTDGFLSGVFTSSEANSGGRGGNITATTGQLFIFNGAVFNAQTSSLFTGGDITVNTNSLELKNGGQLLTNTFSSGTAGNITINAKDHITISGFDTNFVNRVIPRPRVVIPVMTPTQILEVEPNNDIAQAQLINPFLSVAPVNAPNSNVAFSTRIPYVSISGSGSDPATFDYYAIEVDKSGTRGIFDIDKASFNTFLRLFDSNGNVLAFNDDAPNFLGAAGSIQFGAFSGLSSDSYLSYIFSKPGTYFVQVGKAIPDSGISTYEKIGAPNKYDLQISLETPNITGSLLNPAPGSGIFVRTDGSGTAGNISINTPLLNIQNGGRVSAETSSTGKAGDITLQPYGNGEKLTVNFQDGAEISASSSGSGQGGNLIVKAPESVILTGNGAISAGAIGNSKGGNLIVNTKLLQVENGASITVSSPQGQAGNLTVTANTLRLNNGKITAETGLSGGEEAANIKLQGLEFLFLQNNSLISAKANGNATGGNINIDAEHGFVVAYPNQDNDIIANASFGRGGNITITAERIFGLTEGKAILGNGTNDIDASSDFNSPGNVTLKTPDTDPSRGLFQLPTNLVDVSQKIVQRCTPRGKTRSHFISTGRGGLPLNPEEPLRGRAVITNWVTLGEGNQQTREIKEEITKQPTPETIVEVQGWVINADGNVELVAYVPRGGDGGAIQSNSSCAMVTSP